MIGYIGRRFVALVPVWLGITLLTFVLVHSIPGGPFDSDAPRSEESRQALERRYHLDRHPVEQYGRFIANAARGDLGESMVRRGLNVSDIIRERGPVSASLGLSGLAVAVLIGVPVGVFSSLHHNRPLDYALTSLATVGYTIPSFVLALLFMLFFGLNLGWFPLGGWGTPAHLVLPAVALGLPWAGLVARMLRASMLETMHADHVRTALMKGVGPSRLVVRHVMRNSLIPVTTVIGVLAAEMITGSLVVELIFSIPGLGRHMVDSILGSDYSVTLGLTVFFGTVIVFINLLVDVLYSVLDPRIRYR